jgi:hypothetical protein
MTVTQEEKAGDRIRRDYRGRPYIWLPDHSKEVTYTRTSTYAKALSDGDALSWWKMQRMAMGVLLEPRILSPGLTMLNDGIALDTSDEAVKTMIAEIIMRSLDTGGANDAAQWGTTMHHFADIVDFTDDRLDRDMWNLPPEVWDTLDAYVELTKDMEMISGEQFVVCDEYKTAGSYDRTVLWNGMKVVADLKTGAVRFPDHGVQTALYSHSKHYNIETGERVPGPVDDTSKEVGLIIHLPRPGLKDAHGKMIEPSIIPVDIEKGWLLAGLSSEVRTARNAKLAL